MRNPESPRIGWEHEGLVRETVKSFVLMALPDAAPADITYRLRPLIGKDLGSWLVSVDIPTETGECWLEFELETGGPSLGDLPFEPFVTEMNAVRDVVSNAYEGPLSWDFDNGGWIELEQAPDDQG